jgi:hypothetical protein
VGAICKLQAIGDRHPFVGICKLQVPLTGRIMTPCGAAILDRQVPDHRVVRAEPAAEGDAA